jgi:phospholipid/cholesterol/gamma-HCH transport system substrate-binding protein
MGNQLKNFLIGFFITLATAIVIFILMFLHPRVGDEGKVLHVRFTNIDKVNIGTRVTFAGRPVGEVVGIREIEFGREGRTDSSNRLYIYELELRVDSNIRLYNTDKISVRTSGLLGEKNVEITPIAPMEGEPLRRVDNEVIYAEETGSVEDTLNEIKVVANKIENTLSYVSEILLLVRDEKVVEKIAQTLKNVMEITTSLNKPEELSEIITNLHVLSKRTNVSWDTVDASLKDISQAATNTREITEGGKALFGDIAALFGNVAKGEGTIGKILISDDLYLQVKSLLGKGETIFDDINHYGLLFHSDKGWQRLRARRLNLLQKLCTPQEFRNYFNDEIDEISTSLSRVSMLLNRTGCGPCCYNLLQDHEFSKVFAELLRRVSTLEEELRMYNTQVVDAQVHETELGGTCPGPLP